MVKDMRGDKVEIGSIVSWHRRYEGKHSELCRILEIKDDLCLVERGEIGEVNGGFGFVNLDKPDRRVSLKVIALNDIGAMMEFAGIVMGGNIENAKDKFKVAQHGGQHS